MPAPPSMPSPTGAPPPESAAPAPSDSATQNSKLKTQNLSPISPRVCELICALLLLVLVLTPASLLNGDGDTAHHLAVGHVILAQGLPRQDLFSHAHAGQPWLDWEWGAEALFAAADSAFGLNGVALLAAALIAGTLYGLCRWMLAIGLHPVPTLTLSALAATASVIHWLARPHLFSFLLLLALLVVLETYRTGRAGARILIAVPLLLALWANLHPGFLSGLIVAGAYLAGAVVSRQSSVVSRRSSVTSDQSSVVSGQPLVVCGQPSVSQVPRFRFHVWGFTPPVRAFAAALAAGALATLLNPYGFDLWAHIAGFLRSGFLTHIIVEYQPPDLTHPITWGFVALALVAGAVLAATWRSVPAAHWLLIAGWTVLALQAARNILQFSLIVPVLLAPRLVELLNRPGRGARPGVWARYRSPPAARAGVPWLFGGVLAALLLLAAAGGRLGERPILQARWTEPPFPIRAVAALQRAAPPGRMFNDMTWGGYLLVTLWPRERIFIDGQQDAYGEALSRDYLAAITLAPGWQAILARYQIGWAILPATSPLAAALRAPPAAWQVFYADSTAVILTRP